ncbi:hypothetical protein WDZ17_10380 [Pseudokineococcus basanitobsidens]|uniref:NTP pyrophosphohydrolase n=1 Tax=Pseudokineococcus basanitobsidens TaxID=1926649 RepID=A0ABU8RKS4_9ACTN
MTDAALVEDAGAPVPLVLVVDAANVVGSRPDGWWRDRAGASRRLLDGLARLPGRRVLGPGGVPGVVLAVAVVLEGRARGAGTTTDDHRVQVLLAPGSGDDAVVELVRELAGADAGDAAVVVVTADRGLRDRLDVGCWGPGWLRDVLDRLATDGVDRPRR